MTRTPENEGRRRWIHRLRWVALVLAGVIAIFWAGSHWVGGAVVGKMDEKLSENGLVLERRSVTWDPLRGLHVADGRLRRVDGTVLVAASGVEAGFPLGQFLKKGGLISDWRVRNETVLLYDAEGEVKLEKVSLKMRVEGNHIAVDSVSATKDGLEATLEGQVLMGGRSSDDKPVALDLDAVRSTIAALEMERGKGTFSVTGKFFVDARPENALWHADLKGKGGAVVWKGVPLKSATAEAKLTDGRSIITAGIVLPHGTLDFSLMRENWEAAPLVFSGTLKDAEGRVDTFNGDYSTVEHVLTISKLDGAADLWRMARDLPRVAPHLPKEVSFHTFPTIRLRDLKRETRGEGVRWNVESFETKGSGVVSLKGERELVVSDVSGGVVYDDATWKLKNVEGRMLGGEVAVSGTYRDKELRGGRVSLDGVKVAELKEWMEGEKSGSDGVLYVEYRGGVDPAGKALDGKGTMRLENAPVIETPLLDETYDLFAQLIPGVERAKSGEFQAEFTAQGSVVEVTKFEAKGGALTVSAKGTINLETERVKGVARGKLGGVPGLVTSPLSRLLEMNVEGPVDNIRVKPLGPVKLASNLASGTVGVAVDTLEETGRITGEVLKEGVKLPMKWWQKKKR